MQLLRQQTQPAHQRVEAQLALLDPDLSIDHLRWVIGRFWGFWAGNESVIDAWSVANPATAAVLGWSRRHRQELFELDLMTLGGAAADPMFVAQALPVFPEITEAQVFGWLYVAEGSTLGGAMIDRHLRAIATLAAFDLKSFTPYGPRPGAMWAAYRSALEAFVAGDAERTGQVVTAAVATFASLERWLSPVGAVAPA